MSGLEERGCPDCWETLTKCTCSECGHKEELHGSVSTVLGSLQKLGWTTKPAAALTAPYVWVCPTCVQRRSSP